MEYVFVAKVFKIHKENTKNTKKKKKTKGRRRGYEREEFDQDKRSRCLHL